MTLLNRTRFILMVPERRFAGSGLRSKPQEKRINGP